MATDQEQNRRGAEDAEDLRYASAVGAVYERADIHCGDAASYAADLKKADEWVDVTMATKKAKADRARGCEQRDPR